MSKLHLVEYRAEATVCGRALPDVPDSNYTHNEAEFIGLPLTDICIRCAKANGLTRRQKAALAARETANA